MSEKITLVQVGGDEPCCPKCKHHNAMLHTWEFGTLEDLKCRDCGFVAKSGQYVIESKSRY
jgi:hypothetical protein